MGRTHILALGLALVGILVGAGLGSGAGEVPASTEPVSTSPAPDQAREEFPVYVSGWVATPGVVEVEAGSIVADAVAAAGGALDGAQLDSINLARPLVEGDHVQIPGPGEAAPAPPAGEEGGGLVSPNRATAAELEELPGVGPVLAQRIVAHREANGPFEVVEDLLEVPGIGEAKLAGFRDLIVVP